MRKLMILLALGLLLGCGGDEEKGPMSSEEFCGHWARSACSTDTVSACQAPSVESCRGSQRDACLAQVGDAFMDNESDACLTAVERAYRDADLTSAELKVVLDLQGACDKILSGPGTEGDDCAEHSDCDRSLDLECVIKGGETVGTCQEPEEISAGFECSDPEDVCEPGFFCSATMDCIAQSDEGEDCTLTQECEDGTYCNAGVCEARFAVDDACTADEQCLSDVCYTFAGGEQVCIDRLRLSRSEPICSDLR